jgi:hypothetical protein
MWVDSSSPERYRKSQMPNEPHHISAFRGSLLACLGFSTSYACRSAEEGRNDKNTPQWKEVR